MRRFVLPVFLKSESLGCRWLPDSMQKAARMECFLERFDAAVQARERRRNNRRQLPFWEKHAPRITGMVPAEKTSSLARASLRFFAYLVSPSATLSAAKARAWKLRDFHQHLTVL